MVWRRNYFFKKSLNFFSVFGSFMFISMLVVGSRHFPCPFDPEINVVLDSLRVTSVNLFPVLKQFFHLIFSIFIKIFYSFTSNQTSPVWPGDPL